VIPVNESLLGNREFEYVTECIRTGWISSAGRFLEAFEEAWASYCGMRYGVAVSNGTAALQVAVACVGLQPGDEVIMPTFTIISCPQAVISNGGVPVLVPTLSRCTLRKNHLPSADYVAAGRSTLQGRGADGNGPY
jgi:perosamine synthetase